MNSTPPKRVLFVGLGLLQDIVMRLLTDRPDIQIIGTANDWVAAKAAITQQQPDVIIMDRENPELIEAELNPLLENSGRNLKVVYLTSADNRIIVHDRKQIHDAAMSDLLHALINDAPDQIQP